MTVPPTMTGPLLTRICPVPNACASSHTATSTAATTITMNAVFQKSSETMIAAPRTTPDAIAAGRLRPARLTWGGTGVAGVEGTSGRGGGGDDIGRSGLREASDLEQLGLLVLEQLVDLVGVLLGDPIEPLLGAGDVVL